VLEASNGEKGINKIIASKKKFNAIFMDCNMPVMDGFKAASIIREMILNEEIEETPVIANSAFPDSYRHKCKEVGMKLFLAKPNTVKELKEILTQLQILK
jgi:CheY-like chemotaxis protein